MDREKNLLDHIDVLVRWRRMILSAVLTVSLVTAVISLILPEAYRAYAVVYPPKERQDNFGFSGLLGSLPIGLLGNQGAVSATDFVPVLKSVRVADAVIRRFDLEKRYKPERREDLYEMVADRLDVELSREKFLSVSYEDETPKLAAEITNAFVEELDFALQARREEQAGGLRGYFEKRLVEAEHQMQDAERRYHDFQKEHMALDLQTQAKSQIEMASGLFVTFGELIIEREMAARLMEPDHPKLKQLEMEISGAREALDRILMGRFETGEQAAGTNKELPEIFIPFREVPALGLEALQHLRDIEIQNAIYQFVRQEYEKALLEEEKETTVVIVLDRAQPPETRSKPRRTLMVCAAAGLSLVLSVLLAFTLETLRGLDPEDRAKLRIFRELRAEKRDA